MASSQTNEIYLLSHYSMNVNCQFKYKSLLSALLLPMNVNGQFTHKCYLTAVITQWMAMNNLYKN